MNLSRSCTVVASLVLAGSVFGQTALPLRDYTTTETPAEKAARMQWFEDARFGMFIHWGLYSVLAGEWDGKPTKSCGEWIMETDRIPVSAYQKLVPQFNPVKFDAQAWTRLARNAGMKYIVITSKHHDGFGLFRSEMTDWCIRATPYPKDPLKELAHACRDQKLTFCLYHSIMDWHHPDYAPRRAWHDVAVGTPDMDRYVAFMKGQLRELLTGYGRIGILWFDGEWEESWTHARGVDLYNYCRHFQPSLIVNNRVGKGRSGMQGMDKGQKVGDYGTPEQEIPPTGFGPGVSWESCMTMNNTWGYRKDDTHWKPTQALIRNLVDCASKGGNYLLNVGPTAEGLIPTASIERLEGIGRWMKVNGEAIYGTGAGPFPKLAFGRCTAKSDRLYLHVFDLPADRTLVLPGLKTKVAKAWLLADKKKKALPCAQTAAGATVTLPDPAPAPLDPDAAVIVVRLQGALQVDTPAP